MTRDIAIEILTDLQNGSASELWYRENITEALDIAIEALKHEPSEDGTLEVKVEDATKIGRVLISDDEHRGGLYYPDEDEPQGDLISRAEAVKRLLLCKQSRAKIVSRYDMGFVDGLSHAINILDLVPLVYIPSINIIDLAPSADRPRGESLLGAEMSLSKWIPVSERLPSEKKAVLICDSGGNRFVGKLVLTDYGYKWSARLFRVWIDIEDGDAWMPLPEPYKGGEDE